MQVSRKSVLFSCYFSLLICFALRTCAALLCKLFNWVHRKFRKAPWQATKRNLGEEQIRPQHSGGFDKTYRGSVNEVTTEYRLDGLQLVESLHTKSIEELVREMHRGLLAIGTLGIDLIEYKLETCDTQDLRTDSEVSSVEIEEMQEKLERVFHNGKDEEYLNNDRIVGTKSVKKFVKTKSDEERADNNVRDNNDHPLQDFLVTPVEPALAKKRKLLRSLSDLVGVKKITKIQYTPSYPADQINPFSSQTPYKSRLRKFLEVFRQTRNSGKNDLAAMKQVLGPGVRKKEQFSKDNGIINMQINVAKKQGEDEETAVGSCESNRNRLVNINSNSCCHDTATSNEFLSFHVSASGYWINSDDEYLVLEL